MTARLAPPSPLGLLCTVVGCARSRSDAREQREHDRPLQAAMQAVVAEWPTDGYRRVTAQVRRPGWQVHHQRSSRLMTELGLPVPRQTRRRQTTQCPQVFPRDPNLVEGLAGVRPDQVWGSDSM